MGSATSSAAAAAAATDEAILIEPADREAFNVVHVSEDVVRRFARVRGPPAPGSVEIASPAASRQPPETRPALPASPERTPPPAETTETKRKPEARSHLIRDNAYTSSERTKIEERDPEFRQKATAMVGQKLEDLRKRVGAEDSRQFCVDSESHVLQCYKENPKTPLNCSQLAKTFAQCVEVYDHRRNQRAK